MAGFSCDVGHGFVKAVSLPYGEAFTGLSMVAPLTRSEWDSMMRRSQSGKIPEGYITLNKKYYAVGEMAMRNSLFQPRGIARLVPDFYPVLFFYALTEVFKGKTPDEIHVAASFPPYDEVNGAVAKQKDLILRTYKGETHLGKFEIEPSSIVSIDEPIAVFANYFMTSRGTTRVSLPSASKNIVFDIGAETIDVVQTIGGNRVLYNTLMSIPDAGALKAQKTMSEELRRMHPKFFTTSNPIDRGMLEEAIRTGWYDGGMGLDCKGIASELRKTIANNVKMLFNQAGGASQFKRLIIGGGGGALVYDDLHEMFSGEIMTVFSDTPSHLQMSGVNGMGKILVAMGKSSKAVKGRLSEDD